MWNNIEGSPWGRSVVVDNISLLEDLEGYKEIYKLHAKKIANPPMAFAGNMDLFYSLSMEEGALNYIGDPANEGVQGQVQTLASGNSLVPLDGLINECRTAFRSSLMVDSLVMGGVEAGKNVTATFVSYAQEMFRKRFANTYELINTELLKPTFMAPFNIMLRYNMLNMTQEIVPYTSVIYVNALSKANNAGDVNNLLNYTQIVAQLQEANKMGVALNMPKTIAHVSSKMSIDPMLVPNETELEQIQQAQQMQMQQMMEAQQAQAAMGQEQEVAM